VDVSDSTLVKNISDYWYHIKEIVKRGEISQYSVKERLLVLYNVQFKSFLCNKALSRYMGSNVNGS
jgi:hypothetical protein